MISPLHPRLMLYSDCNMKLLFKKLRIVAGTMAAIAIMAIVAGAGSPLGAQTRFITPDTAIDLAQYKTVDDCMVLFYRLLSREINKLPYWKDSTELTRTELRDSIPKPVADTMKLCGEKFHPDSAPLDYYNEYTDWIRVFLHSGRDSDAKAIVDKMIARTSWDSKDTLKKRDLMLREVLGSYESSRPLRWDVLKSIAAMFEEPGITIPWTSSIAAYSVLFSNAGELGDSVTQADAANKIIALTEKMTEQERMSRAYVHGWRYRVAEVRDYIYQNELIDSLRKGAPAYVALKISNWEKSRGEAGGEIPNHIGKTAPALEGDFWFARGANVTDSAYKIDGQAPSIPANGKINLVVYLWSGCNRETGFFRDPMERESQLNGSCAVTYAALRRLAKYFPSVNVTIVAHTTGYVGGTPLLTPEKEADLKKEWWLNFHKIPGTLAVEEIKFIRLPSPDDRRIDIEFNNQLNYNFGSRSSIPNTTAYLIDEDGTILESTQLGRVTERSLKRILTVIASRQQ